MQSAKHRNLRHDPKVRLRMQKYREAGLSLSQIGRMFNCSGAMVSDVIKGVTRSHDGNGKTIVKKWRGA